MLGETATPSGDDDVRSQLAFLKRELNRFKKEVEKPAEPQSEAERIAALEQRTWRAEAIARHGLDPEDAILLSGDEAQIAQQAERIAAIRQSRPGTVSTDAGTGAVEKPRLPPLALPPSAQRPKDKYELAEQQLREMTRQRRQERGLV